MNVRDAHSLYLEILAELGPIGLALLVTALVVPLVALWRVRAWAPAATPAAAYLAWLVHAGDRLGLGGAGDDARRAHLRGGVARSYTSARNESTGDRRRIGRRASTGMSRSERRKSSLTASIGAQPR